jgi:serine/threonine-protein kinase
MGTAYLAMRRGPGGFAKLVVQKRLHPGAIEADVLAMFQDEARISARLNHPNVIQTNEFNFDGAHYHLEMEYLDGQPLHRLVSEAKDAGRAISCGVAAALARDVLAGLHHAHELRDYDGSRLDVVHRDVSPQNIFVTYDGRVKVVDFGVAKAKGQLSMTQLGMVKGKIRYMSPEQALGFAVDRRADIFAVGVVLWQLLTGQGLWDGLDSATVAHRLSRGDLPPSPARVCGTVPAELDRICARAMALVPEDRYATAAEMAADLEGLALDGGAGELGRLASELFGDARHALARAIERAAARVLAEETTHPASARTPSRIQRSATSRLRWPHRLCGGR